MDVDELSGRARTRAYRLVTRLPGAVRGVSAHVLAGGVLRVSSGPGVGLKLDGAVVGPRHIQAYGLVRGALEVSVQEALRRTVPRGGTVLDVGANIGFFALLAGRFCGPEGRVVAIAALPAHAAAIRTHAALNGVANIEVIEAAVSDRSGRAAFLEIGESSWSHLADRGTHPEQVRSIDVETVVVDQLLAAGTIPVPDVVKIDVEGSEVAALRGMADTLATTRPVLIVELHETNAEVADLLDAAGYSLENLDGPEPIRDAGPVHVLARPLVSAGRP